MKITGVVSEFNPFHKGHEYLLNSLRCGGSDIIICVMSGNFVQRGEPAVADKYSRAAMALGCGADIVVELPYPYSASGAEAFARGALSILGALGINTLGFGSESGDYNALSEAARIVSGEEFLRVYRGLCRGGQGGAAAYYSAYRKLTGQDLPGSSNDKLGIEYMKAASAAGLTLDYNPIVRMGNPHDSSELTLDKFPSARALREKMLKDGPTAISKWMPAAAHSVLQKAYEKKTAPARMSNIERGILAMLRLKRRGELNGTAECDDGLGERLRRAALISTSLEQLLSEAAAKNYTDARVRRALLFALSGVKTADIKVLPTYTLLLGSNDKGNAYLSGIRRKRAMPLVTKPADVRLLGDETARQAELSLISDSLWTLMLDESCEAGIMIRRSPVK